MSGYSLLTSESMSEGHPDKIADQISDAALDAIIARDKNTRVACETMDETFTTFPWEQLDRVDDLRTAAGL